MGPVEQNIARQSFLHNEPLPERIANAPQLQMGLELYLEAFFDLDSERSHSWGLTRIPYSSIRGYASMNQFDEAQVERLVIYIKAMDHANLERLEARQSK